MRVKSTGALVRMPTSYQTMIKTHHRNHIWEGTRCKMLLPSHRGNGQFGRKQTALVSQRQEDKNTPSEGLVGEAIHGVCRPGYESHF